MARCDCPWRLLVATACAIGVWPLFAGCGAAQTAVDEAAYADEQLLCVDLFPSRASIDACRDRVRARWCADGRPLNEAGACVYVDSSTLADVAVGGLLDSPSEVNTWAPDALKGTDP